MLRLAHRILTQQVRYSNYADDSESDKFMNSAKECACGVVLLVDQIYAIYDQYSVEARGEVEKHEAKQFFSCVADGIPACMPMSPLLWVEWNGRKETPTAQHGWAFDTIETEVGYKTLASNIVLFRDGFTPVLMPQA